MSSPAKFWSYRKLPRKLWTEPYASHAVFCRLCLYIECDYPNALFLWKFVALTLEAVSIQARTKVQLVPTWPYILELSNSSVSRPVCITSTVLRQVCLSRIEPLPLHGGVNYDVRNNFLICLRKKNQHTYHCNIYSIFEDNWWSSHPADERFCEDINEQGNVMACNGNMLWRAPLML